MQSASGCRFFDRNLKASFEVLEIGGAQFAMKGYLLPKGLTQRIVVDMAGVLFQPPIGIG
jgi:hypothetical protein